MSEQKNSLQTYLIAGLAALAGSVFGFFATKFFLQSGFYALVTVGLCCGFAGGFFLKHRDRNFGIACSVLAVIATLLTEAILMPFIKDSSLAYFFAHLQDLNAVTWLMTALGGYMGYSFGQGSNRKPQED